MKSLRTIITLLSFFVIGLALLGGYGYYYSVKTAALDELHEQVAEHTRMIAEHIRSDVVTFETSARVLAGLDELRVFFGDWGRITETNRLLDYYKEVIGADVCYVMDKGGTVIASTNRNDPASFVGSNYSFRPYFKQAMAGQKGVYLAFGVTSRKKGMYLSHPVLDPATEEVLGVVVVKMAFDAIEEEFQLTDQAGILILVDPHGVIFASSREDWQFKLLWPPAPGLQKEIADSSQFGPGPWEWTGMTRQGVFAYADPEGRRYLGHMQLIDEFPGWQLIFLHDEVVAAEMVKGPYLKAVGVALFVMFLLSLLAVVGLFRMAHREIGRRRAVEQEREKIIDNLRKALSEIKTLTGMLPICASCKKIRDDEGYWNKVEHYMQRHSDVEFTHTICKECAQKLYPDDFREEDFPAEKS